MTILFDSQKFISIKELYIDYMYMCGKIESFNASLTAPKLWKRRL